MCRDTGMLNAYSVWTTAEGGSSHSGLAIIHRPVHQIFGRHGNNLVSKLAQGGHNDIMEDQTEPCLPGDVMVSTCPPSFLSFPVRQNETGGDDTVSIL